MHTFDLHASFINNQEGSENLSNKFFYRGNDKYIIFQAQKKYYKCGRKKILKFSDCVEIEWI